MNARTDQRSSIEWVPNRLDVPVRPRCPSCARRFYAIRAGEATEVAERTCPGCGERWQVIVRLLSRKGNCWYHACDLTFLKHTRGFGPLGDQRAAGGAR